MEDKRSICEAKEVNDNMGGGNEAEGEQYKLT